MPIMISVSTWLPVSSGLPACYCLDRHCVLKSLATPRWMVIRQLLPTILCTPVRCAQQDELICVVVGAGTVAEESGEGGGGAAEGRGADGGGGDDSG